MSALLSLYLCLHSYLSFSVWLSLSICLTLPSCISVYLSFFNPYLFFNLFSLCGSLPLMFLFLPRCLSFFLSLSLFLNVPPLSVGISLPLSFFPPLSLSLIPLSFPFYLSLSLSLSLSLCLSLPFIFLSFFLSLSFYHTCRSFSLPSLSLYLSMSFPPLSLFSSLSLSFTIPVSLCIILSLISVFFDNISQILRVLASSICIY